MPARADIEAILASEWVFAAGRHPQLRRTAERLTAEGDLRCLLPGVFCRWQDAATPEVRIRAAAVWAPNAVLTGRSAAKLTFWPEVAVPTVTLSNRGERTSRPGFQVTRERLPLDLIAEGGGCRITTPALTALDLAVDLGGEGIDRVLRLRLATLDDMAEALRLTSGRAGNLDRRRLLLDSRDEPWSEAEREGHRLLRTAGIDGWRGNVPVLCGETLYFLDIGFEALKLGIEIDGRETHKAENRDQFNHDRRKWTCLVNAGWTLLHFAADQVFDEADWYVDSVQAALILRRRLVS